jgi:hypothetical protein
VELPHSVASIGPAAFEGCVSLEAIQMPTSVAEIGAHPFHLCRSLTTIRLSNSSPSSNNNNNMTIAVDSAFVGHDGLKTIKMPKMTLVAMWPRLLKHLDSNILLRGIGISDIGRRTSVFSFLRQNMGGILEVAVMTNGRENRRENALRVEHSNKRPRIGIS